MAEYSIEDNKLVITETRVDEYKLSLSEIQMKKKNTQDHIDRLEIEKAEWTALEEKFNELKGA